jgi:hypothetical protein
VKDKVKDNIYYLFNINTIHKDVYMFDPAYNISERQHKTSLGSLGSSKKAEMRREDKDGKKYISWQISLYLYFFYQAYLLYFQSIIHIKPSYLLSKISLQISTVA